MPVDTAWNDPQRAGYYPRLSRLVHFHMNAMNARAGWPTQSYYEARDIVDNAAHDKAYGYGVNNRAKFIINDAFANRHATRAAVGPIASGPVTPSSTTQMKKDGAAFQKRQQQKKKKK